MTRRQFIKIRVRCSVCDKVYRGYVPKGGDGSIYIPTAHKIDGQRCRGSWQDAEIVGESYDQTAINVGNSR
jgi:hypothetical protein